MKFKKYEFTDEIEADLFIENLGEHKNHIVKLGYLVVEQAEYNEGDIITPPILTDGYCVDVIWIDNKDKDWKDKRIKLNGRKNSHIFYGWEYTDNID